MTHTFCPGCRVRFTSAQAAYLVVCPQCGEPPQSAVTPELVFGLPLFAEPVGAEWAEANEARAPLPPRDPS